MPSPFSIFFFASMLACLLAPRIVIRRHLVRLNLAVVSWSRHTTICYCFHTLWRRPEKHYRARHTWQQKLLPHDTFRLKIRFPVSGYLSARKIFLKEKPLFSFPWLLLFRFSNYQWINSFQLLLFWSLSSLIVPSEMLLAPQHKSDSLRLVKNISYGTNTLRIVLLPFHTKRVV